MALCTYQFFKLKISCVANPLSGNSAILSFENDKKLPTKSIISQSYIVVVILLWWSWKLNPFAHSLRVLVKESVGIHGDDNLSLLLFLSETDFMNFIYFKYKGKCYRKYWLQIFAVLRFCRLNRNLLNTYFRNDDL